MRARRLADERGQALVITVLFLVVLVGMAGMVIDVGAWYVKHRQTQAAADFGALAAAAELPSSPGAAVAAGEEYVGRNLADARATVVTGYAGDARKAEAKVKTKAGTFFLRLLGFDTVDVSARAVARRIAGGVPLAIFAYDKNCKELGVRYNGDGMAVEGGIQSNGVLTVNGNDNAAGSATAGGPDKCKPVVNGNNITFGGSPDPAEDFMFHEWPLYFAESDFGCTYAAEEFKFNTNNQTIPSGVYCATKLFSANGNNQTGTITVLAPEIVIDGDNQRFKPYARGLLFFATGLKELVLNGNRYDWTGVVFHPKGRVKINGDSASVLRGLIEGLTVEINGNGFNMTGTGGLTFDEIALVE